MSNRVREPIRVSNPENPNQENETENACSVSGRGSDLSKEIGSSSNACFEEIDSVIDKAWSELVEFDPLATSQYDEEFTSEEIDQLLRSDPDVQPDLESDALELFVQASDIVSP